MLPERRQLQVVVVSQDVTLLHSVSWILEAVGYQVQTSMDFDQGALWRRYSTPDFALIDGRGVTDPTATIFALDSEDPFYRIFLYDSAKHPDLSAWYTAGAHDGIRTPLSRGELLSRLRTGARYLEFERRLQARSPRRAVPGMYSRRGFLHKLRKLPTGEERTSVPHGLLVTAIDWYSGIRRRNGETASRSLVSTAARAIKRAAGDNAVSAYLGDGRFATLVVGQSSAAIKSTAESLAKDFCSRESHHESMPRPTLTSAVVPWAADISADRILNDALETLDLAELSGGDCTLLQSDFNKEITAWKNEMATGNPFAEVVAQDIMVPFPMILHAPAELRELTEDLFRVGVTVQPYVDHEGKLVGVAANQDTIAETHNIYLDGGDRLSLAMPETIRYDTTFSEIYEAFSSRGCATLVVTADDRPLGYVTFDGFIAMIEPITTESFAHRDEAVEELAHLIVPITMGDSAANLSVGV